MNLRKRRIKAGISQQELADKSGIPRRTIQNWERDLSNARVSSLKRVADVLGCKVDDLICGTEGIMSEHETHEVVVSICGPVPDWCGCEIVRCRDCKYQGKPYECWLEATEPDEFCSRGERKEGGE